MISPSKTRPHIRLAADIGGTYTDLAVFDERTGALAFGKTLSTPQRLVDGIDKGVEKAASDFRSAGLFLHGSTVAINTILERTGARTALLITEGFRDIYEIGRINRPDAYNLFFRKHVPLVERRLRVEGRGRLRAERAVWVGGRRPQGRRRHGAPAARPGGRASHLRSPARGAHRGGGDSPPALLRQRGARDRGEAHRRGAAARGLRLCLARALAGVPRVRALLDHGGERVRRADGAPLRRRHRRASAWLGFRRLLPHRAIHRRAL